MSFKFCIKIESNSQKTFFAIVLYTNMAAVTSRENQEFINISIIIYIFPAEEMQEVWSSG